MEKNSILSMYKEIYKKNLNGLFLVPLITGQGKTYNSFSLFEKILSCSDEELLLKENKKIFFEVPDKINLDQKALEQHVAKNNYVWLKAQTDVFDYIFNFCESNKSRKDSFLYGWIPKPQKPNSPVVDDFFDLDTQYKRDKEIRETIRIFINTIEKIKRIEQEDMLYADFIEAQRNHASTLRSKILSIARAMFICALKIEKKSLNKKISQSEQDDIIRKILSDKGKYSFILELLPSIYFFDKTKKIFLLTTQKALKPIEMLFGPPIYLYQDASFVKNNIRLYVKDEIDQSFVTMKKEICENASNQSVSLLDFARTIKNRKKRKSLNNIVCFNESLLNQMDKTDALFEKKLKNFGNYNLNNTITLSDEHNDSLLIINNKQFLFDEKNDKSAFVVFDKNINGYVITTKETPVRLHELTKELSDYCMIMSSLFAELAEDFMEKQNEKDDSAAGVEKINIDTAISNILQHFLIDKTYKEIVKSFVLDKYHNKIDVVCCEDATAFNSGISYVFIEKNSERNGDDILKAVFATQTPENQLILLSQNTLVFGLSATCEIQSIINNFNIEYIEKKLEDKFIHAPLKTKQNIKNNYIDLFSDGFKQIDIKSEIIDDYLDIKKIKSDLLSELFNCKKSSFNETEIAFKLKDTFQKIYSDFDLEETIKQKGNIFSVFCEKFDCFTGDRKDEILKYYLLTKYLNSAMKKDIRDGFIFNTKGFCARESETERKIMLFLALILAINNNIINNIEELCSYFGNKTKISSMPQITKNISQFKMLAFINSKGIRETNPEKELKLKALKDLSYCKFRYIVTSYQTMATGQNFRYPIPFDYLISDSKIINIRKGSDKLKCLKEKWKEKIKKIEKECGMDYDKAYQEAEKEYNRKVVDEYFNNITEYDPSTTLLMDISGGAFSCPTNTIVSLAKKYSELTPHEITDGLYLISRLKDCGQTTINQFISLIKITISSFGAYKSLYPIRLTNLKTIVQAIGRTQRGDYKRNCSVFVFDNDCAMFPWEDIEYEFAENYIINQIRENIKSICSEPVDNRMLLKAQIKNSKFNSIYENLVGIVSATGISKEKDNAIEQYKKLRENIFISPTLNSTNSERDCIYVLDSAFVSDVSPKVTSYSIKIIDDTRSDRYPEIFVPKKKKTKKKNMLVNSKEDLNTDLLMRISETENIFTSLKNTGEWTPGTSILCPTAYRNVYVGVLGEKFCQMYFSEVLKKELDELPPEIFEKADFTIKDKNNIYVDAKYHKNDFFETQLNNMKENAIEKARKIRQELGVSDKEYIKFIIVNMRVSTSDELKDLKESELTSCKYIEKEKVAIMFVRTIFEKVPEPGQKLEYVSSENVAKEILKFIYD